MARALGRYELLRPLARGGMAEVYLARRRAAGIEKWLVVKRMRPETSGDPRFLDLFVREARLSMSLVHQNIVPVFDFGRIDDQVFLAMERVEGKDLGSSLSRGTGHHMPPLLAAFVAAECCQALDYAHQRKSPDGVALGIVHRDVTPRNVLLSWSGEVKLTDFGIAALAGDATSRLLGTPHYMAPEQARSEPIDPRADIYAIGLVLREAVTGVRPRPGGDRDTILEAARSATLLPWPHLEPPALPVDLALGSGDHTDEPPPPAPPAELIAIIDRATAALPADRYPDARSMLEDIDSFIVGERAARKVESPARQLAAWLAVVWEGARDDLEADAAIDGDHLVSFLDDGAIDVLGTGTVRSMAATAAEDLPAAPATPPPAVDVPVLRAASEPSLRPGRVSSSQVTVASGSFHTMPASAPARAPEAAVPARRSLASRAGMVMAGLAAAVVVFVVARRTDHPDSAPPPVQPPPEPRPAVPAVIDTPHPDAGTEIAAGSPDAASPSVAPAPPSPAPPSPAPPSPAPPSPGRSHPVRPNSGHPAPEHLDPEHPVPEHPASDPVAAASPAVCKVRINLTPWAYYTADGDAARHETPSTVELAPGRHRLHVWNPELHVERDITINVPADRDAMNFSEPLQPASLSPTLAPGR
jgi:hypothetical protein